MTRNCKCSSLVSRFLIFLFVFLRGYVPHGPQKFFTNALWLLSIYLIRFHFMSNKKIQYQNTVFSTTVEGWRGWQGCKISYNFFMFNNLFSTVTFDFHTFFTTLNRAYLLGQNCPNILCCVVIEVLTALRLRRETGRLLYLNH